MLENVEEKQLTCCVDCSLNFENEAKSSRSSSLPSWLADEKIVVNNHDQVRIIFTFYTKSYTRPSFSFDTIYYYSNNILIY